MIRLIDAIDSPPRPSPDLPHVPEWIESAEDHYARAIKELDPFQMAIPCWTSHKLYLIPPEVVKTRTLGDDAMPIRVIDATEARPKARLSGKFSNIPEVDEVMSALRSVLPGKAIELQLSPETTTKYTVAAIGDKKATIATRVVAGVLTRKFKLGALPFSAYAPDAQTVIVVREAMKVKATTQAAPRK